MTNLPGVALLTADFDWSRRLADELTVPEKRRSIVATESAEQLHRALKEGEIECVVVEDRLEGFFNGFDILQRIHQDLLRPATILLVQPRTIAEAKQTARDIGIDRVLPADAALREIGKAIDELLPENREVGVAIRAQARNLVEAAGEITPMPQILVRLAPHLLDQSELSVGELTEAISVDPRLAGQLLALVNSSAYGMRHRVTKLQDAVNLLGSKSTIGLVLANHLHEMSRQDADCLESVDRLWFQRRTVLNASTAYAFARSLGSVPPDTAYVLGLFQEIGILVLARAAGKTYQTALRRVRGTGQLRLEVVERALFHGMTHADMGAALLEQWGVPTPIIRLVLEHHSPEGAEHRDAVQREYLRTMQVGEALANLLDGHFPQRYPLLVRFLDEYGPGCQAQIKHALKEAIQKTVESATLFRTPLPDAEELVALERRLRGLRETEVAGAVG